MDTSAAQIQAWLLAASAGIRIVDDLIEHGHELAAMSQVGMIDPDTAREIVTQVERGTPDDMMLVTGAVLSGAVMPWILDRATGLDSPLRPGYLYPGWGVGAHTPNGTNIIPRSRAAADPRALAAESQLLAEWRSVGSASTIELTLATGELGFVIGHVKYIARNMWPGYACDLAARDVLDPEIALMITLQGVTHLNHESITSARFAMVLTDAFERKRQSQMPVLVLPPVIV